MNLYIIPHAGGSSYSYNRMSFADVTELRPIALELPGHGKRISEPLLCDAGEAVEDLLATMKKTMQEPYALMGHSLGGLLAFLVAQRIQSEGLPLPVRLFVSACTAPSLITNKKRHLLESGAFWNVVRDLGGMEAEFIADESFRNVFEPILRADFMILERFAYQNVRPLTCPLTLMLGDEDEVFLDNAQCWAGETSSDFSIEWFSGDHFYIFKPENNILKFLSREIQPLIARL